MSDRELRDALEAAQARARLLQAKVKELEDAGADEVFDRVDELEARVAVLQRENEELRAPLGGRDLAGLLAHVHALEESTARLSTKNLELRGQLETADRARTEATRRHDALRRELAAALKEQDRLRRLLDTERAEKKLQRRG